MSIDWDSFFFGLAHVAAKKSKDPSTQVGCVIVDENDRMVSMGFNGFPKHMDDKWAYDQGREFKLKYTLHAEENAVAFAGKSLEGCRAYLTHPPCGHCLSLLKQVGISSIYYIDPPKEWKSRWGTDEMLAIADHLGIKMYYGGHNGKQEEPPESSRQEMGEEEGEGSSD